MWTDTTRKRHARKGPGLPSDLTDGEWEILEPFLPLPCHVGRPRKWPMRRIGEAMLYLLRGGLPWRMLSPGFPPTTTVQRYFLRVARQRPVADHQPLSAGGDPHGRRARGQPVGRGDRQSER